MTYNNESNTFEQAIRDEFKNYYRSYRNAEMITPRDYKSIEFWFSRVNVIYKIMERAYNTSLHTIVEDGMAQVMDDKGNVYFSFEIQLTTPRNLAGRYSFTKTIN